MNIKSHPQYTNYFANEYGEVFSQTQKINPTKHHTGYMVFSIKKKQIRVHRFIIECFIGEIPKHLQVNHKDGNKTNNCLNNLEVVTAKENNTHAIKTGLKVFHPGEKNGMSKLTNTEAKSLILDIKNTNLSNLELGNKYQLHSRYISLVRHKRRWVSLWKQVEGSETISQESRVK